MSGLEMFSSLGAKALFLVFGGLLVLFFCRLYYVQFIVFKRMGIKGPKPRLIFGNLREYRISGPFKAWRNWMIEHGKILGFSMGPIIRLLIADPDALKQLMVKDFDCFMDRETGAEGMMTAIRNGYPPELIGMPGEPWRQTRRIVSPVFSSRKLKLNAPIVEASCVSLVGRMNEVAQSRRSADIWRIFGQFSMEVILATAFGQKIQILQGEANDLTRAAKGVIDGFAELKGPFLLAVILGKIPLLRYLVPSIAQRTAMGKSYTFLLESALQIVQMRRELGHRLEEKDLLQMMIDARADDDETDQEATIKSALTDKEIVSLSVGFLLAGYDTTANTLGYVAYLLAVNPDKQDILIREIDDYLAQNKDMSMYEKSLNIEYLDWVVMEGLRIFPPVPRTVRTCCKSTTIAGITIPVGMRIVVPIHAMHYLPEFWHEPRTFRPERFSPEEREGRNPLCHMPFGWGPRRCVGMRLALMEVKMALVYILQQYKFVKSPETEVPLKTSLGITLSPANGIWLSVVPRDGE